MKTLFAVLILLSVDAESRDLTAHSALMPGLDDHTFMWWAEGFPSHAPAAPWLRCVQTGRYALVLDTGTMQVAHFGAVDGGLGYDAAVLGDNSAWMGLPAADLMLGLTVEGKSYRCTTGGKWSRFKGPRTIESGRFFQRADVTDLAFTAADGTRLNVEARFETAAWADRLGLILSARPGMPPIQTGEESFGRIGGGFGLDGTNHLEIPHRADLDPERFTLELWAFVPADYQVSDKTLAWLVCKNHHEEAEGNYGITMVHGRTQARMNIGGGRDNAFVAQAAANQELKIDAWNHLAMSYDGDTLRLYLNGGLAGESRIGRRRMPGRDGLAIGRRQDNSGDGYHFRGVVDEIRLHDRALTAEELRLCFANADPRLKPVGEWAFRADGEASMKRPAGQWKDALMEIALATKRGVLRKRWDLPEDRSWASNEWHDVSLALDPAAFRTVDASSPMTVTASDVSGGKSRPVDYDPALGWHRVNLDGIEPVSPRGIAGPSNDAIERVKLVLSNPTDREQPVRLMFEKTARGIRQRIGFPITGVSAMLRDIDGHPTGIPVQLSKNWHNDPQGAVHAGQWFHGISQVRLPPASSIELELTLTYGHWGGVAAASHSQLCLIGWGSNQLWETSALGSWGESICYEPDQVQAACTITDVRPLMVRSMGSGAPWSWTSNVGGGDFFRFFDPSGNRIAHSAMRTAFHRQGPCLTEVTHAGRIGNGITHSSTVSLARGDDVVRGIYQIRLAVKQAADFSRLVIFQAGADTYSYTGEEKMAIGNETGLLKEWDTHWGGNTYRTAPMECTGRIPWVSLHQAAARKDKKPGAWANRGIIIRAWKARLGGKAAAPWIAERGITLHQNGSSTLDILPPPGVTRLEPGDFVEATIEHVILPQFAKDYYGPNRELRAALERDENTWRMVHREAVGNDPRIGMKIGMLQRMSPAITIGTVRDKAAFTLTGGLGYLPLSFTGLSSPRGHTLRIDGQPLNQSIHGNDFWQTDYDAMARSWSITYNVPVRDSTTHDFVLTTASVPHAAPAATGTGTPDNDSSTCMGRWQSIQRRLRRHDQARIWANT